MSEEELKTLYSKVDETAKAAYKDAETFVVVAEPGGATNLLSPAEFQKYTNLLDHALADDGSALILNLSGQKNGRA